MNEDKQSEENIYLCLSLFLFGPFLSNGVSRKWSSSHLLTAIFNPPIESREAYLIKTDMQINHSICRWLSKKHLTIGWMGWVVLSGGMWGGGTVALDCLGKLALGSSENVIRHTSDWMLDKETGSVNVSGESRVSSVGGGSDKGVSFI